MSFDPYTEWLGLPTGIRPPDPFTLLGVHHSDSAEEIERAADSRIQDIRNRAPWERQRELRTTISQILRARNLLLDPASRKDLSRQITDIPVVQFSAVVPSSHDDRVDLGEDDVAVSEELDEFNFHQPSAVTETDEARAKLMMTSQQTPAADTASGDGDVAQAKAAPYSVDDRVDSSLLDEVKQPAITVQPTKRPAIPLPSEADIVSLDNVGTEKASKTEADAESNMAEEQIPGESDKEAQLPPKPTVKPTRARPTRSNSTKAARLQADAERARAKSAWIRLLSAMVGIGSCVGVLGYAVWVKVIKPSEEAAANHVEPIVVAQKTGELDIEFPRDIRDTDRPFAVRDDADDTPGDANSAGPSDAELPKNENPVVAQVTDANPALSKPEIPVEPIAAPEFPEPNPETPATEPPTTPDPPTVAGTDGGEPPKPDDVNVPSGGEPRISVPLPPAKPKPTDPSSVAHGKLVRELLSRGFGGGREDLAELEALANKAKGIKPQDPQADYALGLVQWKRLQWPEAMESFAAARQLDPKYGFAWQAEIMLQIRRRQHEEAFATATDFAANAVSDQTPLDGDSVMAALWLGRLAGYLSHPRNEILKDAEQAREVTAKIASAMPEAGTQKFKAAQAAVVSQVKREEDELRDKLAGLQVKADERRAESQKEIDKAQEKLDQDTGEVKKSAEEWKKWIDKQLGEHDKVLEGLAQTSNRLTLQAQTASTSISVVNSQIATIELQAAAAAESGVPSGAQQILPRLLSRRNQLANEYAQAEASILTLRNQVGARLLQRQADIEKYRKATGKLITKKDSLKKYEAILDRKEKNAQGNDASVQAQSRALRRKLYALETYVPFDLEVEQQRLMEELP